jgi:hypothetical protein
VREHQVARSSGPFHRENRPFKQFVPIVFVAILRQRAFKVTGIRVRLSLASIESWRFVRPTQNAMVSVELFVVARVVEALETAISLIQEDRWLPSSATGLGGLPQAF